MSEKFPETGLPEIDTNKKMMYSAIGHMVYQHTSVSDVQENTQ